MSSSSSSPVCPAREPKTSTSVLMHLCALLFKKRWLGCSYLPCEQTSAPFRIALSGYESMSSWKVSRMARNGEEAIVERASRPGPRYLLPPPLSISISRPLCVCASCSASVQHLAYVQSSLASFSLHYSLKMGCHHHRRLCISVPLFSPHQCDRIPSSAQQGRW